MLREKGITILDENQGLPGSVSFYPLFTTHSRNSRVGWEDRHIRSVKRKKSRTQAGNTPAWREDQKRPELLTNATLLLSGDQLGTLIVP